MTDVITPVIQGYLTFKLEHVLPAFFTIFIPVLLIYWWMKQDLKKGAVLALFTASLLTTLIFIMAYYSPSLYLSAQASQVAYGILIAFFGALSAYFIAKIDKITIPDKFFIYTAGSILLVELFAYQLFKIPVMAVIG